MGDAADEVFDVEVAGRELRGEQVQHRGMRGGVVLAKIVDRCLAKRKAERYGSATELLADLTTFLAGRAPANELRCPYRGLVAFNEGDAEYFFGRSSEVRTALAQLETWPLLAVIGPSGVGKSSFVHAGLVPAIRSERGAWALHVLRPGRKPLQLARFERQQGTSANTRRLPVRGRAREA